MAHILPIPKTWLDKSPKTKNLVGFVNVDKPVGPKCPNLPDDVRLVQGLIRIWGGYKFSHEMMQITTHGLVGSALADPDAIYGASKTTVKVKDVSRWWQDPVYEGTMTLELRAPDPRSLIPISKVVDQQFRPYLPTANGICDETTITWIRMFQMVNSRVLRGVQNGRVDPATAQDNPATPGTIMVMNAMRVHEGFAIMPKDYMKPTK